MHVCANETHCFVIASFFGADISTQINCETTLVLKKKKRETLKIMTLSTIHLKEGITRQAKIPFDNTLLTI